MAGSFTHLHVHTEFSMLDGASRVGELAAAAAADGQPAMAMTDHGNMYGVLDFYRACKDAGVKPIIGTEAYMAHDHRSERPKRRGRLDDSGGETDAGKLYYHLCLLAENQTGYKNLIQLSSRAYLEGYYYKPRIDWELLDTHSEGVIATTGCLGGHVLQELLNGNEEAARRKAGKLQDIFGRDNMFVEIQDHGIAAQRQTNPQLIEIANYLGAPLVATNDTHYTHAEDHQAHDALLCVQTASLMSDPDRFKFEGNDHYVKSSAEMRDLFREVPSACDNTLWIAERCDVEIEFGDPKLPKFPLPEGFETDYEYLEHLTFEGARKRWGDKLPDATVERLAFELKVINDMGFSSYFLITGDLIQHARDQNIRVGPGRGSAAGCAVSYCLRITDLDPIKYDLLFERFLNPGRRSMPDIDMDFDSRYRDEMIRYMAELYGREHVAQIVTFSTIKARAAVRDAARVLGHPYIVGDRIAKLMPPLVMGRDTPLYTCLEKHPKYEDGYGMAEKDLRELHAADPEAREVIDVALGLEGLRRGDGIHAAAVVVTDEPLTEYLPIQRKPESGQDPADAPVVTQYEMGPVEDLGLLKLDFLGLRNLDVISDALEMIKRTQGIVVDIDDVDLEDQKTFELLQRGDTIGVFQLESSPMRALIRSLAPDTFDDVAALVALYRPGPMAMNMHNDYADRKNGRLPIELLHDDAAEILSETYGLMIYQESMMRIAQKFAGYSLEEADNLRKACGKKIREVMAKEKVGFIEGCVNTGYGNDVGEKWWEQIEPFADYTFNKSHSYGYGFIAFQYAYLKANFPVEYMASLLTSVKGNLDKAAGYLHECRIMGIDVMVPDVNLALSDFSAAGRNEHGLPSSIVFGLSAVRNVGEGLVSLLVEEREANGTFDDFLDFCERVDPSVLNKRTIEALIKAGGFDSMGYGRKGLLQVFEQIIDLTLSRRRERDMGIQTLFGELSEEEGFDERPKVPELFFEKTPRLAFEKEMLGLYISDHPLAGIEAALRRKSDCTVPELKELADGEFRSVGGVITNLQRKYTRKQDLMAVFELEDLEGSIEVMVFPRSMLKFGHMLRDDAVVLVKGRVKANDDERQMICNEVEIFEARERVGSVTVKLGAAALEQPKLDALKEVILRHPGDSDVLIEFDDLGKKKTVRLSEKYGVDPASPLMGELRVLLGSGAFSL